jgi:transposase
VAPEKLLRALLLQVLYSGRSERMLMEQLHYNFLFSWFVGLDLNETVWNARVFKLVEGESAQAFLVAVLRQARGLGCCRTSIFPWMAR